MTFSVTILGSSSALPTAKRFPTAHVLSVHGRLFLIDCAEGTQMQIRRNGLNFNRIDHIYISHLHGDHVLGIFGLISTFNLLGRVNPLHIFAHKDFEPILRTNINFFVDKMAYEIVFHPIEPRKAEIIFEDDKISVMSLPLAHRVPCCGFLFKEKQQLPNIHKYLIEHYNIGLADIVKIKNGADYIAADGEVVPNSRLTYYAHQPRSYAYCSDTQYLEKLVPLITNVDLLYHEATFLEKDKSLAKQTGHSTALQAATIAKKANVKKLIIGHFSSRYKTTKEHKEEAQTIFKDTIAVNDGDVFEIDY